MRRSLSGFTCIELLIVLVVIATFMGCLFPIGSVLKHRAQRLALKTDAVRYQAAFLNYFEQFGRFPKIFPKDQWFDIANYSALFIHHFSGREASASNPDRIEFCEFNADEWAHKRLPSIHFFLCHHDSPQEASHAHPRSVKVYGTRVLFYLDP